ncbi:MAG: hypothetical protein AB1467_03450 [Candidatus Diapherotrites archaeon]
MNNPTKALILITVITIQLSFAAAAIDFSCSLDKTQGNANFDWFTATMTMNSPGTYRYCFQWTDSDLCSNPNNPNNWDKKKYAIEGSFDVNGFARNTSTGEIDKRGCGKVYVGPGPSISQNIINIIEMDAVPRKLKMDENILFTSTVKNLYEGEVEVDLNFYISDESGNSIAGPSVYLGPTKIAAGQSYRFDWNYTVKAPLQAGKNYFINSKADANYTELPEYKRDNERRTIFSVVLEERTTKGMPETNLITLILTIAAITAILSLKHQHKKEKYIN